MSSAVDSSGAGSSTRDKTRVDRKQKATTNCCCCCCSGIRYTVYGYRSVSTCADEGIRISTVITPYVYGYGSGQKTVVVVVVVAGGGKITVAAWKGLRDERLSRTLLRASLPLTVPIAPPLGKHHRRDTGENIKGEGVRGQRVQRPDN